MNSGPICIGDPDGVPESGVRHDSIGPELRAAFATAFDEAVALYDAHLREAAARVVDDRCGHVPNVDFDTGGTRYFKCGEQLSAPDPAALLGPVREPVDWDPRDAALIAAPGMPPDVLYDLRGATLVCEDDEPLGVYERDAAGDEEC